MNGLPRLRSWLRAAFRRPQLNREMDEELAFHVDRYAENLERGGIAPAEARRRARAELGGFDGRREAMRQALGLRLFDELRGDVRYALRLLRRSPGFALAAILSLALGIGANTAIFSLVDEVLLKALPVAEPERLYFIDNAGGKSAGGNAPPYPCYEMLRDTTKLFSGLAMFNGQFLRVVVDGSEERVRAQYASGNYFDVLGVRAMYGRTLTPADDIRGGDGGPDGPVAVISFDYWRRRFGANPDVLGKRIQVAGKTMLIVGVTPPEFFGLTVGAPIDLTMPVTLSSADLTRPRSWWFSVVGRLKDGASAESGRAELDAVFQSFMTSTFGHPPKADDYFNRIALVPANRGLHEIRRQFSTPLTIVMVIVALVLLIGCANVANLVLARSSARDTEMTVRAAIGAGRGRLVRQLLTEGLVLAGIGAAGGLLVAHWGAELLVRMVAGTQQQILLTPRLDGRVLAFASGAAVITGLLCSLTPAFSTARLARANAAIAGPVSRSGSRRISQVLVVVQVTLSLVLLCGASLFVRTLRNLQQADAGFRSAGVLSVPVEAVLANPPAGVDPQMAKARVGEMWEALTDRAGRLPGVTVAAAATLVPMSGRDRGVMLNVVGAPALSDEQRAIRLNQVSPRYFDALGVRLITGRVFRDTDAKTVVLAKTAARAYFAGSSPLGRFIDFGRPEYGQYEVVGVVEDTQYENLRDEPARVVYIPLRAPLDALRSVFLTIRAGDNVASVVGAIREDVRRSVPGGFVGAPSTVDDQVAGSLLQERLVSLLASIFGVLALALACIGLYGLLSYAVIRRTREIGVRMALGARRSQVTWIVLKEILLLAGVAVATGLAIVLELGGYLHSVLFDVAPNDPLALGSAVLLLVAVGLVAAYFPARRACTIDPTRALKEQ